MTLCVAWRRNGTVHFASDSRLTVAKSSYADVAIKVMSLPLTILNPVDPANSGQRTVAQRWDLGMCFAGSAVSSLFIKESVSEVLKGLQHAPGYTDTSMKGVASFIFTAYKLISSEVCATAIGRNGRASLLIGGMCNQDRKIRVFQLSTDVWNTHQLQEVLTDTPHVFVGSGAKDAAESLPQNPTDIDYINVLKSVINDTRVPSVGGHIQYGCFKNDKFVVYGIVEFDRQVHYWRGALDLNSPAFMAGHESFIPGFPYIDPFSTFSG